MTLLCTHPSDPQLSDLPPDGSGEYLGEAESLLSSATDSVEVVCPFIDETGVLILERAFARSNGDATWQVYTRNASDVLAEMARRHGWIVYEYRGLDNTSGGRGFHCKVIIADRARAIIGSTNLIYTNLMENVELGVLVDDPDMLARLVEVVVAIRRVSTPVC